MGDPFVRPGVDCETYNDLILKRHPGTGDADTTKHDWLVQQHRDTISHQLQASNHGQLLFLSAADNVSTSRLRMNLYDRLVEPCGPIPRHNIRAPTAAGGDDVQKRTRDDEQQQIQFNNNGQQDHQQMKTTDQQKISIDFGSVDAAQQPQPSSPSATTSSVASLLQKL